VYRTDLIANVRARTSHLELPEAHNPFVRYPTAIVNDSRQPDAARSFIDLLLSPAGQKVLRRYGFLPADAGG
ncbi:MAG: extracellular solute-binding protein, partial [Desulfuromonadales bacterium]|nr:extracellular solute-binding protein [Desulfuromonadales bacterium]NIS40565.1 extracellular solute-binding protein [Desulfuromonadales bacterium]